MTKYILILPLLLASCMDLYAPSQPEPSPLMVRFALDSLPTYDLEAQVFTSSDSLGRPDLLAIGQSSVYVGDQSAPQVLLVFDAKTGEYVKSVGNRGEGPSELAYLWSLDFKAGSDSGWLFDFTPKTMHFFNGDSLTGETVRLRGMGAPMGPVWTSPDSIASAGLYDSGRLALYGSAGAFTRTVGPDPAGAVGVPVNVRQHAYEAKITTNRDGSLIAIASINTDQLEIYNQNGLLHLVRGPHFHDPVYTTHGNDEGASWLSIDDETIKGYVDVAATDDLVFALYSGMDAGTYTRSGWWSPPASTVIAFTWRGQPRAALNIQDGALRIGISESGTGLYAIYHKPVPMILRYEVPGL